jgi:hypothetical protein
VVKNISIKNNKLCKTKPISKKPKMNLSHYTTKEYENKSGLLPPGKQTQSNPISQGRLRGKKTKVRPTVPCRHHRRQHACANAITSGSVLGNLAILKILSIKSCIPFSTIWCPPDFLHCFRFLKITAPRPSSKGAAGSGIPTY